MSRIRQFFFQYRGELWCLAALYAAALITHWPLSASYQHWNDPGYHSHMAQLLQEHWRLPVWDERWRGGIVVNYPILWPLVLAVGSALSGFTVWEVYPYMQVAVWAMVPCSIFVLVRVLSGRHLAAFLAAGLALYPSAIPDQTAFILSAAIFPLVILVFLRLLRAPSVKGAVLFGLLTGLLFYTHGSTFQFIVITFAITMVPMLILLAAGQYSIDGRSRAGTLYRLFHLLALSVLVFFAFTSYWWITSLTYYGLETFHTPIHSISRETLAMISEGWTLRRVYGANNVLPYALLLSMVIVLIRNRDIRRQLRQHHLEFMYFIIFSALAVLCYAPMETLGYSLSVPWRYYLFIHVMTWMVCGMTIGAFLDQFIENMFSELNIPKLRETLKWQCAAVLVAVFAAYATWTSREWVRNQRVEYTRQLAFPFPNYQTNMVAMHWLDSHVRLGDVVAARTTLSTRLLYFTRDAGTLGGHYGGSSPDVDRDRALNTILYSKDYGATQDEVRRYGVTYIYVDLANPGGGFAFEDSDRWHESFGGYDVHKLITMYDAVYSADGVIIFRTDEDDAGGDDAVKFENSWRQKLQDMVDDVDLRTDEIFSEDFRDLDGWEFATNGVDDVDWGIDQLENSVRLWMNSKSATHDEEVFASEMLDPESFITVAWDRMTVLKVRYRASDADTKLHLAVQIGPQWYDIHISSESFDTHSIYLPLYAQGKLKGIHWGIWETDADTGKHWLEVDSITIQ